MSQSPVISDGLSGMPSTAQSNTLADGLSGVPSTAQSNTLADGLSGIPSTSGSSTFTDTLEGLIVGIRAKQMAGATFTQVETSRTFVDQAIEGAKLVDGAVTSTKLAAAAVAASGGLVGGGGTDLAINTTIPAAGLTFSGTGAYTFPVDNLQVTGTPVDPNDPVNYAALTAALNGRAWRDPVCSIRFLGNITVGALNTAGAGFGAADEGKGYLMTDAGTLTLGSVAVTAGDIVEWDGTQFVLLHDSASGFPADGVRVTLSTNGSDTLLAPYTDGTDDGKIAQFDGTSLTGALTTPTDGDAVLVKGDGAFNENNVYAFQGTVPTGTWVLSGSAVSVTAGAGMSQSGQVFNIGDVNKGVQVNTNDLQVDASEIAGAALRQSAAGGEEHILELFAASTDDGAAVVPGSVGTGLSIDGDIVSIDFVPATGYTPNTSNPQSADSKDLSAHLNGIASAIAAAGRTPVQGTLASQVITGTDTALTAQLPSTPLSNASVELYINGIRQIQGAGADYTVSGTVVTILAGSGTAVDLDATDIIDYSYLT